MAFTGSVHTVCGFECQDLRTSTGGQPHWDTKVGSPTIDTAVARTVGGGVACMKIDTTGGAASTYMASRNFAASTRLLVARFYIMRSTNLATTQSVFTAIGNSGMRIYLNSDGKMGAQAVTGTTQNTAAAISADVWHRVDLSFDRSTGTARVKWAIDGVAQTDATFVTAAADMTGLRFGMDGSTTGKFYLDDLLMLTGSIADYPIGDGSVRAHAAIATGTHSFTSGDFQNEASSNLGTTETASWSRLDEIPATITEFVKQVVIRSTGYLEYQLDGGLYGAARAVEVITTVHNLGTGANTQKTVLWDGTTAVDGNALSSSGSVADTLRAMASPSGTNPSGGDWTTTALNALRVRWGYSNDVTTVPALDGVMAEVEYPPFTNAAAGQTTGTGASNNAGETVAPNGANAAGTGAAANAAASLKPNAAATTGTGAANNATVTAQSATNANAGATTGTGAANAAVASVAAAAQSNAGTGAAANAGKTIAAPIQNAAGTGAALNATVQVSAVVNAAAGAATGTGAAAAPVAKVSVNGGLTAGAGSTTTGISGDLALASGFANGIGAAFNASPAPTQTATATAATGTGLAPSAANIKIAPAPAVIAISGSTPAATVALLRSVPTAALGTAAAFNTLTSSGPYAPVAAGTGAAPTPLVALIVYAENAFGGGQAIDAVVVPDIAGVATLASGTGVANDIKPTVSASASAATGIGTATQPTFSVAPSIGNAVGTGTAYNAGVDTLIDGQAPAGIATGTATAPAVSTAVMFTSGQVTGTGVASSPVTSVRVNVTAATGTGAATNATPTNATLVAAGRAAGTGTAYTQETITVVLHGDIATGAGSTVNAVALTQTVASAGAATGTGAAFGNATATVVITVGTVTGTGATLTAYAAIAVPMTLLTGSGAVLPATTVLAVQPAPATAIGTGIAFNPATHLLFHRFAAYGRGRLVERGNTQPGYGRSHRIR